MYCTNEIVKRIIKHSFGYFDLEKQKWKTFAEPIKLNSKNVLFRTNQDLVTRELVFLLKSEINEVKPEINEEDLIEVIRALKNSKRGSEEVSEILKCLIYYNINKSPHIVVEAIQFLGAVRKNNSKAVDVLVQLLTNIVPENFSCSCPENWSVDWDHYLYCLRREVSRNLDEVDCDSSFYSDLLRVSEDEKHYHLGNPKRYSLLNFLEREKTMNSEHLFALTQFSREHEEDETTPDLEKLWSIYKGNQTAIDCLIDLIKEGEDKWIHQYAVSALIIIGQGNKKAINTLIKLVEITEFESICLLSLQGLGQIGKGNSKLTNFLIELINNCPFSKIYLTALESLLKIAPNSLIVTQTYTQLISNYKDEKCCLAALSIINATKIFNCEIKETILIAMHNAKSEHIRELAAETLWNISPGHPNVIKVLSNLYRTSQEESFSNYLDKMKKLKGFLTNSKAKVMKDVVTVFKGDRSDEMMKNDARRFVGCYEVLFHCAQNLPYPDFYNAWHSNPPTPETNPHQTH